MTKVLGTVCCRRFPSLSIVAYRTRRGILAHFSLRDGSYVCLRSCTTNLRLDRRSYIQVLKTRRRISNESSTSNLQRAYLEHARHYNLQRREWRPTFGSQVWLRQHPLPKAAKVAPKCDGPYTVAKFTSPNLVRLQRPGDRRRRIANISQLKPYYAMDTSDTIDNSIAGPSNPAW